MMVQCVIYFGLILMVLICHEILHLTAFTDIDGWGQSPRGAGYLFGGDVVKAVSFLSQITTYF